LEVSQAEAEALVVVEVVGVGSMVRTFLQAEWRKLAVANYVIDKNVLSKYLPAQTEIDLWNNTCYVSLVGFMFLETKIMGFKIPFHVNFEEVNLRFYVRYNHNGNWKRGVVFIKEIVPKPALTLVANTVYQENYETMPMSHEWRQDDYNLSVSYKWKKGNWNSISINARTKAIDIDEGSEEEFITEHYWGYTKTRNNGTAEYEVEHPRWLVYPVKDYSIDVNFGAVYGSDFDFLKTATPKSVFLAEGSLIKVKMGKKIR
jgi:uncharacterized protein